KMTELDSHTRSQIVSLEKASIPHTQIAKILDLPPSSVSTTLRRFKATSSIESRPRTGRPKALTKHDTRQVLSDISNQPQQTWRELGASHGVSGSTVARAAQSKGLNQRVAR
ncbi:hypothetical protein BCR39DRAFT_450721, partial [Naematelia encephala]